MSAPEPATPDEPVVNLDEVLQKLDSHDWAVAQATESLDHTLSSLKLSPAEEQALAAELGQLHDLSRKLEEQTLEIAAFGMVSRGKSSVMNALLGREVFKTGSTHGTTVKKDAERWEFSAAEGAAWPEAKVILIDTPGIDEVGGEGREKLARDVARHADLILFVISSDMQRREFEALEQLREAKKPIILVFNQIDRFPDTDRDLIHAKLTNERVRNLIRPEDVVLTAAKPDPYRVKIQRPDGTTTVAWEQPPAVIEPLKLKILEVLEREGKALIALNTLLFAGDVHEEIVRHKLKIRDEAANKLIWNFCIAKGAAVGLNPIPVADLAGGLAVDVGMIVALSKVYGIPVTRKAAIGLVKDMVKALGAMGAVEVATRMLASGVKAALGGITVMSGGLGLPLTLLGYGAVGLTLGSAAATTSYVIGQAAKVYLEQGCQWGPRGIKNVISRILDEAKAGGVVERLRDDLREKIQP